MSVLQALLAAMAMIAGGYALLVFLRWERRHAGSPSLLTRLWHKLIARFGKAICNRRPRA
jgi:drug/metabolite transporter superfamily protein YnfA